MRTHRGGSHRGEMTRALVWVVGFMCWMPVRIQLRVRTGGWAGRRMDVEPVPKAGYYFSHGAGANDP